MPGMARVCIVSPVKHILFMKKIIAGLLLAGIYACSPSHKTNKQPVAAMPPVKKDSTKPVSSIKSYKDIVTAKTITQKGLFTVHQTDGKYYFELPDSLLGREIMVITRFIKTPAGAGNYGGEEITEQTIRWEKGPSNNLFLRAVTLISAADSTNTIYKAVTNANVDPIIAAFDIKAYSKDSTGTIIEVTDFFKGESPLLAMSPDNKRAYLLGMLATDRSYIKSIHSYPINTEIRTVKTWSAAPPTDRPTRLLAVYTGAITMEFNNSFILLPKTPMQKRLFDYRVGYFASEYNLYGDDQQQMQTKTFIHRWRLEPREEDMDKWKRGELVTPKKQIVYYIDPATPKKWRPYLMAGINDWQQAFEKAGFKNAILAREWPEGDTTMSLEDARFSVLRYFASPTENAYGPNIADPRSGEIIESHIGWYHNVMKLVHDWYMIQTAAIDPRARKMVFEDSLMGQLIRFVSSHEIGHTLGLRHNMGASSRTPVENLRNKAWVEAHGHTPSIMDYARFNYVAQPEDSISSKGIYPRIGEYDKWAIQWGYTLLPGVPDAEGETAVLNKWIIDSVGTNPLLWFSGEGKDYDPRSQAEDLGDDNMKASEYGIKNLKRIVPKLIEWTKEKNGDDYDNLTVMYKQVLTQFDRYCGHVLKNLAGVYQTAKSVDQPGDLYVPVPKAIQKQTIAFLGRNLFQTPQWLLNNDILNKINNPALGDIISQNQGTMLMLVMSGGRLTRLESIANRYNGQDVYRPDELLSDIEHEVWTELVTGKPVDYYRRKLQRAYINNLAGIIDPSTLGGGMEALIASMSADAVRNSDVKFIARHHLITLKQKIADGIKKQKDVMSREHLEYALYSIGKILDDKKK